MHQKNLTFFRNTRCNSIRFMFWAFTITGISLCVFTGCCNQEFNRATAVAGQLSNRAAIVGSWSLAGKKTVRPITFTVTANGEIYGSGGVNSYNGRLMKNFGTGSFVIDGTLAATMKYAHGINEETHFFQQLNQVDSWVVNSDNELELRKGDQLLLRFIRLNN